ncbi:universal stress protein [Dactylosporangium aurantiacum]|uniref:Universal stress protein n=1 Tax=Dactylosporangium aurantiacum TaxID=35754 RepID=A0A9Q9MG62_9ACTN|nr:universal stress protein [Dactylosporangium aurantiacum]MDG6105872.1 universal stress protein [Dactylosporangium aurantiacum]UWZ57953.1 universal stress protein [Dactylosporangium aurantiacum]
MQHTDIVVGTDGSTSGTSAVRWAADHAARTGARLRVVCVYQWHLPGPIGSPTEMDAPARGQAEAVVAAAVADARGARPGLDVQGSAVLGLPTDALLTEAKTAALLVVGSHGRGALASALLGSVGLQVATHAEGPVVVVRGRAHTAIGPVVAGVGDGPAGERVLTVAFEEAYRRRCGLVAVHTVEDTSGGLARLRQRYPAVPVEVETAAGNPADVLVAASRSAQLVVLDGRGRDSVIGALLEPVTHHLLQRADCPVLLLREVDTAPAAQ